MNSMLLIKLGMCNQFYHVVADLLRPLSALGVTEIKMYSYSQL